MTNARGGPEAQGGRWAAPAPEIRATVRCIMVPADVGPVELSQHFVSFGKIVDMRLRIVRPEEGGKGEKEALVQFAGPRQAQACVSVSALFLFYFVLVAVACTLPAWCARAGGVGGWVSPYRYLTFVTCRV